VQKPKKAHAIKSHHNVGGLPESLHLQLLEPLRDCLRMRFASWASRWDCRARWCTAIHSRAPAWVCVSSAKLRREYADLLRRADAIFIEELHASGWYEKTSQAFTVFLPVKSVGVMGDGRTYEWVVALRAVQTQDFMTAHWAELPHALLGKVSNRIINEVRGINRVVYDISGKPPATIEWE